jgi:hypothetical protein
MNKLNLQRLLMMQLVIGMAKSKQQITDLVASFKQGILTLTSIVNQLSAIGGQQSQTTLGGSSQKEAKRLTLDQITYFIISASKGYFLSIGNVNAAKELRFSYSGVKRVADGKIIDSANYWKSIITPHLAALADWGISASSIQLWNDSILAYSQVANLPSEKINTRKQLTAGVNQLIKEGMAVCKNTLDTSINSFNQLGEDEFIQSFKIARKLKPAPGLHTRIDATVVNELGEPQFDALVTVNELVKNNKTYNAVSASTDLNGFTTVREFEPGYRTVTVSGKNVTEKTFGPFKFQHGKDIKQTFEVAPAFAVPASKNEATKELVKK